VYDDLMKEETVIVWKRVGQSDGFMNAIRK